MGTFPTEVWQEIFALACTDTGHTGRSLSLVSKYFNDISSPFKYQSLAITQWRQIIIFSHIVAQLPDSQKKTKYLFVNCPHPFADSDGDDDPILGDASPIYSEDEVGAESDISESDSDLDSKFERSLTSEDEMELMEDVNYLQAVFNGLESPEGSPRDNVQRDAEFDNLLEAFHAILNEISSTLTILGVCWTSQKPPQLHRLLPLLPCLQELHLYRSSISYTHDLSTEYEELPTIPILPLLRFLYISGDYPRRPTSLAFTDGLARLAPNLTHLRCPFYYLRTSFNLQKSLNPLNLHVGGIILLDFPMPKKEATRILLKEIEKKFDVSIQITIKNLAKTPEAWHWQRWWESRVAGEIGPWSALIA